jgi:hemerythrin
MPAASTWNDQLHSLNLPEMDQTHREFVALLGRAQVAPDGELLPILDELLAHTRSHFAHETEMMAACALGSRNEHEAEHRRVLGELEQMRSRAEKGRLLFVRAYLVDGAPDWFRNHLATMDADLAGKYKQAFPA